jgi:hypothetical protein
MSDPPTPPPGIPVSEPYLPLDEVAERLGVPARVLMRRVEAGDVPARREDSAEGTHWRLRLSDLGVETDLSLPVGSAEVAGRAVDPSEIVAPPPTTAAALKTPVPPAPERRPQPDLALLDFPGGPRQDLTQMSIDPRELVSGLLDRWERTLEQRVYAEQRHRFEAELLARQAMVKELRMELQAARAEHAAAQAEKDRLLAEKEYALADRERALAELKTAASRRRGWFFRR